MIFYPKRTNFSVNILDGNVRGFDQQYASELSIIFQNIFTVIFRL